MNPEQLFSEHSESILIRCRQILSDMSRKALVLGAGTESMYFEDDQPSVFRPLHHFSWFCPHRAPESLLLIQEDGKPALYLFQPDDFWYDHESVSAEFWASSFDIKTFATIDEMWTVLARDLSALTNVLFYGAPGKQMDRAKLCGHIINDSVLNARLNWERSFKTSYEIASISQANKTAALGHLKAKELFLEGASERQIHLGYLAATDALESELPYTTIVGLNEKGAVLHYQEKRRQVRNGKSLLIDAGVMCNGYASDITRTHTALTADPVFCSMAIAMDTGQQDLCSSIQVGQNFADIHRNAHLLVGNVLLDHKIIKSSSAEDAFEDGITNLFLPHGFGHLLGLFVHDVAGLQTNKQGAMVTERKYKYLRSYRDVAEGMVFTVEPGLYFIDTFLEPARQGQFADRINWQLVDQLKPYGGIRVEDNIAIENGVPKNLTREFLK